MILPTPHVHVFTQLHLAAVFPGSYVHVYISYLIVLNAGSTVAGEAEDTGI